MAKAIKKSTPTKEKNIERKPDGTIELKLTLPWTLITRERKIVVDEYTKNTTLPGFRKGKAPKKLVEEKIDEAKVREQILKELLPQAYFEAVKANSLKPIMDPKFHIEGELKDGEDWKFHALTCEPPVITLGNYKPKVKIVTAKSKIIVPGKEKEEPKLDDILEVVAESAKIQVPSILAEKETDRLLSGTLEDVKKLGMTLDQYLTSTGKSAEDLRLEYHAKAEKDLKLELVLQEIAKTEKITVDEKDIQKAIDGGKNAEEKKSMENNKYLLASILKQQKTLDFLKTL